MSDQSQPGDARISLRAVQEMDAATHGFRYEPFKKWTSLPFGSVADSASWR